MTRRTRRRVIAVLVWLAIIPLLIEGLLQAFDPWGARYFDDLQVLSRRITVHNGRVVLPPGVYRLSNYTTTQLADYSRLVPGSQGGPCRVVFVGDSVTWGQGVDDGETWVNLIAAELSNATVTNAAYGGYNSENVHRAADEWQERADALIYLVISNDHYASGQDISGIVPAGMVGRYLFFSLGVFNAPFRSDWPRFWRDMDALTGRVIFAAFDDEFGRHIARYYPVQLIPQYHSHVSRIDSHPDATGHREIAAAMLPIVRNAVRERCTAVI